MFFFPFAAFGRLLRRHSDAYSYLDEREGEFIFVFFNAEARNRRASGARDL
jgi:hypothetical protein